MRAKVDAGELTREEAEAMVGGSLTPPSANIPTPTCRDYKDVPGGSMMRKDGRHRLDVNSNWAYAMERTPRGGGRVNPEWREWLMAWPIGWTESKPLATDKFQSWLQLHGGC